MKLQIGGSPCTHCITVEWRPMPGHEKNYEISSKGDARRKGSRNLLAKKVERNGYVRVRVSDNGIAKDELVHRLVAIAFIENPNGYKTVNHIDENKQNNRVCNLEWCDMSYQNSYGNGAKSRNTAKMRAIDQFSKDGTFLRRWDSIKSAAESLGLNPSTIVCVCKQKRRYKTTGGFSFRYADDKNGGDEK